MVKSDGLRDKIEILIGEEQSDEFVSLLNIKEPLIFARTLEEKTLITYLKGLSDLFNYKIVVWDLHRGARLLVNEEFISFSEISECKNTPEGILNFIYMLSLAANKQFIEKRKKSSSVSIQWSNCCDPNFSSLFFNFDGINGVSKDWIDSCSGFIFVLLDFGEFLSDNRGSSGSLLLSRILHSLSEIKPSFITTILSGFEYKIPRDLDPFISYIDIGYPSKSYLKRSVDLIFGKTELSLPVSPRIKKMANRIDDNHINEIVKSGAGLTQYEFGRSIRRCIIDGDYTEIDIKKIQDEKKKIISKSQLLDFMDTDVTLADVGGLEFLKDWIRVRKFCFSEAAMDYGISIPKGLLLTGFSGTGKSLICKAVANEWQIPLVRLDMGRLFGSLMGQSEANMRDVIAMSEAISPCILFLDEIEKAVSHKKTGERDGGTSDRILGSLLTWMQEKTKPVFVIATCNDIFSVPVEMVRAGRFDDIFFVDLPNEVERVEIFNVHFQKRKQKISQDVLSFLVNNSDGFCGAEIEKTVNNICIEAFLNDLKSIDLNSVKTILSRTIPISRQRQSEFDKIKKYVTDSGYLVAGKDK